MNKYVGPPYCRTEMYAGRVACCFLVSHVECEPRALLRLEKRRTDKRTDGRQTVTLHFSLDAASVITATFKTGFLPQINLLVNVNGRLICGGKACA